MTRLAWPSLRRLELQIVANSMKNTHKSESHKDAGGRRKKNGTGKQKRKRKEKTGQQEMTRLP